LIESLSIDGWPLLLLLSGIAGSSLFAWGVRGHFVGDKTPGAMQVVAAGFCLHLLAIALFGWAVLTTRRNRPAMAFAGDRPDHVFRSGPYATIRHPFYTAYLLFWLGCAIATSSIILFLVFLSLAVIYTIAALGEERNFSRSAISDEYEAFRKATGFFWPKVRLARR
jgi:protein-S-isoprenylcysteine O-methyltransferase Ste14